MSTIVTENPAPQVEEINFLGHDEFPSSAPEPKKRGRPVGSGYPSGLPQAPIVAAKRTAAADALTALRDSLPPVALRAAMDFPGGAEELAALEAKIADAQRHLSNLELAYKEAVAADERLIQAQRAFNRKEDIKAVEKLLGARDAAAVELGQHIDGAVAAYRTLVDSSAKAYAAMQRLAGGRVSQAGGFLCGGQALYDALDVEMLVASTPTELKPGALTPKWPTERKHIDSLARASVGRLADRVRQASASALAFLRGEQ